LWNLWKYSVPAMVTHTAAGKVTGATLKRMFKERGLSRREVAARAGIRLSTLRVHLSMGFPRRRLRLVMETALDASIWTSEQEFIRRKALRARLHFDPWTIRAEELRRQMSRLEIKGWRDKRKRRELIELLEQQLLNKNQHTGGKET